MTRATTPAPSPTDAVTAWWHVMQLPARPAAGRDRRRRKHPPSHCGVDSGARSAALAAMTRDAGIAVGLTSPLLISAPTLNSYPLRPCP
jgi:hypothetical protein